MCLHPGTRAWGLGLRPMGRSQRHPGLPEESCQVQEGELASSWVVSHVLARLSEPAPQAEERPLLTASMLEACTPKSQFSGIPRPLAP